MCQHPGKINSEILFFFLMYCWKAGHTSKNNSELNSLSLSLSLSNLACVEYLCTLSIPFLHSLFSVPLSLSYTANSPLSLSYTANSRISLSYTANSLMSLSLFTKAPVRGGTVPKHESLRDSCRCTCRYNSHSE